MLTVVLLLAFTLLCILLSADRAWDNVTKPERNALVFEGRHRAYGAFVLRREYDRRFMLAFAGAIGIFSLSVAVPKVVALFSNGPITEVGPTGIDFDLTDIFDPPPTPPVGPPDPPPPTSTSLTPPVSTVIIIDTTAFVDDTTSAPPVAPVGPVGPDTAGSSLPPGGVPGGGSSLLNSMDTVEIGWLEELPVFPGGDAAMIRFVNDHVRFPDDAFAPERVYVGFVVNSDGSVIVVKARNGRNPQLIREAERVVKGMPRWQPGKLNGRAVACRLVLPIAFQTK